MYLEVPGFLGAEECAALNAVAGEGRFADGLDSARDSSHETKKNQQLNPTAEQSKLIDTTIANAFKRSVEVQAFTQASNVRAPMLSRYQPGMYYRPHLDAPILYTKATDTQSQGMRSDLSMTVFLSDPQTYDGGALILQTEYGDIDCKPEAGTAIIYSTLLWHEVEEVTRGERVAIVSWFQSRVRDPLRRSALFDLTLAMREVTAAAPDSEAAKRLKKVNLNLMRLWSDG